MNTRSATRKPKTKTRTILLFGFEGCTALDLTGPHKVFALSPTLRRAVRFLSIGSSYLPSERAPFAQRWAVVWLPMLHGGLSINTHW
jgi:hypothetical protein